jgi:hypothetical protein
MSVLTCFFRFPETPIWCKTRHNVSRPSTDRRGRGAEKVETQVQYGKRKRQIKHLASQEQQNSTIPIDIRIFLNA